MQIQGLHKNIYIAANIGLSTEIRETQAVARQKILGDWELLKSKGLKDSEIQGITGISRATYYRRRKRLETLGFKGLENLSRCPQSFRKSALDPKIIECILNLRRENPTYGKAKITLLLARDFDVFLSESTIGRILKTLMNQGKILKYRAAAKVHRMRKFTKHAQRWRYGMKGKTMGEMIQIDHMSVHKNGVNIKHFQAWDPVSKTIVADVYSTASSAQGAKFLEKVIASLPFPIKSIQVDGGSEFMKDFEAKCEEWGIPLFVLPPKKPQWNGGVERGNRTFREDFYDSEFFIPGNLQEVREQLEKAVQKYNTYRPHQNLGGLTPWQYVKNNSEEPILSHML